MTQSKWRAIDSAPKDGTEVIVMHYTYYGDGLIIMMDGPYTAAFTNGKWVSSWDGQEVVDYMDWGKTDYKSIMDPTHWIPLPSPPKEVTNDQ